MKVEASFYEVLRRINRPALRLSLEFKDYMFEALIRNNQENAHAIN